MIVTPSKNKPAVSVIVPVYNVAPYLRQCLDSLVNQTLQDIEIICVNDGSTDECAEILSDYAYRYGNIIVKNQSNKGPSAARNNGLATANGNYIGFVDGDDWVNSDYYEEMLAAAFYHNADIVVSTIKCFSESLCRFYCDNQFDRHNLPVINNVPYSFRDIESNIFDCAVSPCNKLYRREILIDNNVIFPCGRYYEDYLFYLKTFYYADIIVNIDCDGYCYRTNRPGSTMTHHAFTQDYLVASRDMVLFAESANLSSSFKRHLLKYIYRKQHDFLKRTSPRKQEQYFQEMIYFWKKNQTIESWGGYDEIKRDVLKLENIGYEKWKTKDRYRQAILAFLRAVNLDYPLKNLRRRISHLLYQFS